MQISPNERPNPPRAVLPAELERVIATAIFRRAERETLWDMPLSEIDLDTMAEEIAEKVRQIDGSKCE